MALPLKVLFFDIETAPLLTHTWQAKVDFIPSDMFIHDSFLFGWAGKWADGTKVLSDILTPEEALAQSDARVVESLASEIRKADIIVAHNIARFDLPMLNNRLFGMQLEPVGPVRTIDTLTLARQNFRLAHHKLDYLAKFLGLPRKLPTDFDLWLKAYHGDKQALRYMEEYNKHDVVLLEQIFEKMKPYVRNLPRLFSAEREMERACPFCGSDSLQIRGRGTYITQGGTWVKFQCQDCKRYSRSRSSNRKDKLGVYPL